MQPIASQDIFSITTPTQFEALALKVFQFQFIHNAVYNAYCQHLGKSPDNVHTSTDIPFLPISFFKTHSVLSSTKSVATTFTSSGTTGSTPSQHHVVDLDLYRQSCTKAFTAIYGPVESYCVLALLPAYLERKGSSLVYMANDFIAQSKHRDSGFYLYDVKTLHQKLLMLEAEHTKTLLLGVSFALLDLAAQFPTPLQYTTIMETGGMKGRRKEMIREELHASLKKAFSVANIHSEYGMTELLSQAYSQGNGVFTPPPWMKVLTRDTQDPLTLQAHGKTGGLNVIDLANTYSCSFIATQDLGKTYPDGTFSVLGRYDHSEVRGCNLMAL